MELVDIYKNLRRHGNTVCEAKKIKDKKSPIHDFIEKYGVEQGNVLKSQGSWEVPIVVLWVEKEKMTDEVGKDVVEIMKNHGRQISLESVIGEFKADYGTI